MKFKLIRKKGMKVDWTKFLSSTPARDYIFQKMSYEEQMKEAAVID